MPFASRLVGCSLIAALACACSTRGRATSEDTNTVLEPSHLQGTELAAPVPIRGGPIEITRASNVRYLGVLPTSDGRHLRPNSLLRSGHWALVDDEGYAQMVRLGLKSVVDFRSNRERQSAPDAPWVTRGTRNSNIEVPEIPAISAGAYLQILTALEPSLPNLFTCLGSPGSLPALLHCGTGRGRACIAMVMVLLALGVSPQETANDFANNQETSADPQWLTGVFARVQRAGGIDAYLGSHGVMLANLASLRAQALE